MTGIGIAALLFAIIFLGLMVTFLTNLPAPTRAGTGRDGAHIVATRTTALADNPPGPTSMRDPNTRGRPSAS